MDKSCIEVEERDVKMCKKKMKSFSKSSDVGGELNWDTAERLEIKIGCYYMLRK